MNRIWNSPRTFGLAAIALAGSLLLPGFGLAPAQTAPEPVAYWFLDEPSGAVATDAAGTNHLQLTGNATWAPDQGFVDGALALNGAGAFAAANDGALDSAFPVKAGRTTTALTLSAWIYPTNLADRNPILSKQASPERGFMFSAGTSNGTRELYIEVFRDNNATTGGTSLASGVALREREWQHVAATYQFTTNGSSELALYIDGTLVAQTTTAVGPLQGNAQELRLGSYRWGTYQRHFAGRIDEVQVYDQALSLAQIQAIVAEAELQANNLPPVPRITANPASGDIPLTVSFDATASTDPDGSILSYLWNFGDGGTGSGALTSHVYSLPGLYNAVLTVVDDLGKSASASTPILASDPFNTPPVPAFTARWEGPRLQLDASASTDPDGTIVTYNWTLGDGNSASGVSVAHTYQAPGSYQVTLIVTDNDGSVGTLTQTVQYRAPALKMFEVNRLVTKQDRGFPWNQPPAAIANGDWTAPIDYASGTLHLRAEIRGQPIPQDMRLQFCVWQYSLTLETCSPLQSITGTPGAVAIWSRSIPTMWKKNNEPIDWANPRQRYGLSIKNANGDPVSDFLDWNWNGEDPDAWYPLDIHFTVVNVPPGQTFAGWTPEVLGAPLGPLYDTTPPQIGTVNASVTATSATLSWTTNEAATAVIRHGTSAATLDRTATAGTLALSQSVTLTGLLPETTYYYRIEATDGSGNTGSTSTLSVITASDASAGRLVSDDFTGASLDPAIWTFVNPLGDGSVTLSNGQARIAVPGGVAHDVWTTGNQAPRIMQSAPNTDFEIEARFASLPTPTQRFQSQGLIVEQSAGHFLRYDIYSDGSTLRAFAAVINNGSAVYQNALVLGSVSAPITLRLTRSGSTWTPRYSLDGTSWQTLPSFSHSMTVSAVGLFAGNAGPNPPTHTAIADYFFDTANPLDLGGPPVITAEPMDLSVPIGAPATFTVTATGDGALTYQWERNGSPLAGATAPTLELPAVSADDDGARFAITVRDSANRSVRSREAVLGVLDPSGWWSQRHDYRVPLTIRGGAVPLTDKIVTVPLDLTSLITLSGDSGGVDPQSLRILETTANGEIIATAVPFQFDPDPDFHPLTNARGELVLLLEGATAANGERFFQVYFGASGSTYPTPPVLPRLEVTDGIDIAGQDSFRINTLNGDWYYHKAGGGFATLYDRDGNDWISYSPLTTPSGAHGDFRGIPNLVPPASGGHFHPGRFTASSSLLDQGPLRARIRSTTTDNLWQTTWEMLPYHATLNVDRVNSAYWFLYEGTPGGLLDTATDLVVRSDGTQTSAATAWSLDIPGEEWVYIGDPAVGRSLFVANHQLDTLTDRYFALDGVMSVLGFGRANGNPLLTQVPARFSVGFIDTLEFANAAPRIRSAAADGVSGSFGAPELNPASTADLRARASADRVSGGAPLTITVNGTSSTANPGPIASYVWNFGDGTSATDGSATHTFTQPGTYTVTLTVSSAEGLMASDRFAVVVGDLLQDTSADLVAAAQATPTSGVAPLTVEFSGLGSTHGGTGIATYDWDFGDGTTATGAETSYIYTQSGTYTITLTITDTLGQSATTTLPITVLPGTAGPTITVWQGFAQTVGGIGIAQPLYNLLGNVSDPDGVGTLTYRLNGGPAQPLSLGPFRRNEASGDFNAEIAFANLVSGPNQVVLTATDTLGYTTTQTVTLSYTPGRVWPSNYSTNWPTVAKVEDAAQIVDGRWGIVNGRLRTTQIGYDRLVAIGDTTWTNYEVLVPVTIHGFNAKGFERPNFKPAVGVMLRWPGHTPWTDDQPSWGYYPAGGGAWYELDPSGVGYLALTDFQDLDASDPLGRVLNFDVTYWWRVRVETLPDGTSRYRARVWPVGTSEPANWQLSATEESDVPSGSLLLVAHYTDVSFGNVVAQPIVPDQQPSPTRPLIFHGVEHGVNDGWRPVSLPYHYENPVVVASVQYNSPPSRPVVTRVRNAFANGFELRLQNPSGQPLTQNYSVHYVVVEAGTYTEAEHGITMEAARFFSDITHGKTTGWWQGSNRGYNNDYTSPVVVGQVMSDRDPRWSVFWARGTENRNVIPDATTLRIGKHVGEDTVTTRESELIGYIVLETGAWMLDGVEIAAAVTPTVVQGTGNAPPYRIDLPWGSEVSGAVVSAAGMKNTDGGWPILYGANALGSGQLGLAFEEDQIRDLETMHPAEQVAYLAVGAGGGDPGAPIISAPSDRQAEATGSLTPVDLGTATTNDGSPVTSDAPLGGFPLGTTTVTWTATNDAGTSTATQRVTVSDTTPPQLSVPPDLTVDATGILTPVDLGTATATDLFGPVTLVQDAPADGFPLGITTVTWTATDANGNSTSATQRVTVVSDDPPPASALFSMGRVTGVGAAWQTVTLARTFTNPVVIASVQYPTPPAQPAVTRVRNASGNQFELRVQNPSNEALTTPYDVQYLVVEAGVYTQAEHGITMEAATFNSTTTNSRNAGWWQGTARTPANAYTTPVVLGQVMTANDTRWSVFWARGPSKNDPPNAGNMILSKHVGEDSATTRSNETIGYLVIEAGSGSLDGLTFEAGVSAALVAGTEGTPPYAIPVGSASPTVAVVSAAGMKGGDGGWPVLYGATALGSGQLGLAIEEDQIRDLETTHIAEQVAYILFQ